MRERERRYVIKKADEKRARLEPTLYSQKIPQKREEGV
jgi:hypothetical protein